MNLGLEGLVQSENNELSNDELLEIQEMVIEGELAFDAVVSLEDRKEVILDKIELLSMFKNLDGFKEVIEGNVELSTELKQLEIDLSTMEVSNEALTSMFSWLLADTNHPIPQLIINRDKALAAVSKRFKEVSGKTLDADKLSAAKLAIPKFDDLAMMLDGSKYLIELITKVTSKKDIVNIDLDKLTKSMEKFGVKIKDGKVPFWFGEKNVFVKSAKLSDLGYDWNKMKKVIPELIECVSMIKKLVSVATDLSKLTKDDLTAEETKMFTKHVKLISTLTFRVFRTSANLTKYATGLVSIAEKSVEKK